MSKYGLRKKPTYNSLIDYIQNEQPNIKYPNRLATQITNSREMSKLDGLGMIGMEAQQQNLNIERQRQMEISELANQEGTTARHVRSLKPPGKKLPEPTFFDLSSDSNVEEFMDDIQDICDEEDAKKTAKATDFMRQVVNNLVELVPSQQDFAHRMASVASSSTSLIPKVVSVFKYAKPSATTDLISGGNRPLPPYIDPADVDPNNPYATPKPKVKTPPTLNLTPATPKPKSKFLAKYITAITPPAITAPPAPTSKARSLAITEAPTTPPLPTPKSKSKIKTIKQVGVTIIENNDKAFWARQNISVLKEQAQLRGYKFTDLQIKGGGYGMVRGKKVKQKGLRKADYLEIFLNIVGL